MKTTVAGARASVREAVEQTAVAFSDLDRDLQFMNNIVLDLQRELFALQRSRVFAVPSTSEQAVDFVLEELHDAFANIAHRHSLSKLDFVRIYVHSTLRRITSWPGIRLVTR